MKKALATASLLALLAVAPAIAQTTPSPSTTPSATPPPSSTPAKPPAATPSPPDKSAAAPADKSAMTKTSPASADGWQASKLMGHKIVNANRENIGDVNDFILDSSGKVTAVIVGVGGFLGMGEKSVALTFDQLSLNRDANNNLSIMVNQSKDSLEKAPEWTDPNRPKTAK